MIRDLDLQTLAEALSRQISIGGFRRQIRPSAAVIREQKQRSSSLPLYASGQYRIYSDNAVLEYWGFPEVPRATRHAGKRVGHGERLLTIGGHLVGLLTIHRKERLLSTPHTRL